MLRPPTRLWGLWIVTALMMGCTNPGYNDNPSQQMADGRVGCPAATEFFGVYFNVHIQPLADSRETRLTQEVFRAYCEDLPMAGTVFFTADLVGPELRRIPIGIRLVEQQDGGIFPGSHDDLRVLSETAARRYEKGVIEAQFEIDQPGHYAIELNRGGDDPVSEHDRLRIPLNVGVESGVSLLLTRLIMLAAGASLLAVAGSALVRIRRRAKMR